MMSWSFEDAARLSVRPVALCAGGQIDFGMKSDALAVDRCACSLWITRNGLR